MLLHKRPIPSALSDMPKVCIGKSNRNVGMGKHFDWYYFRPPRSTLTYQMVDDGAVELGGGVIILHWNSGQMGADGATL